MKLNKIRLLPIAVALLFFSVTALASEDFDGWMSDNQDGTYNVRIENDNGDIYTGTAQKQPDGTYTLNVEDRDGDVYTGTATKTDYGDFTFNLQDETYGGYASGSADMSK